MPQKTDHKRERYLEALAHEGEGQLTVDVYQTPSEIVVESAVAGVTPDQLDVEITPEMVTIRGELRREEKVADKDYFYRECYWGKFSRSIILPSEIDPDKSDASFTKGILRLRLPKIDRTKSKKLKVKGEG
ncbi:MAG: Hsp20/alpha crystallin family protein [Candidatus Colwellbacteria bacterium]|nr:Hsp20/alpha crystallin family protein [Candidatus Colwellbacteria bacterium]